MKYRAALIVALSLGFSSVADARSDRVEQIPNGTEYSCTTCHVAVFPTGPNDSEHNAFGLQVEQNLTGGGAVATQEVDWQALYDLDADGDGYTNGEELGDPDGEWAQEEEPPRGYDPSHPGDASSHQCDNLDLEATDACDSESEDAGSTPDAGADAGNQEDTGGGGTNDGGSSDDGGCSATGAGDPVSAAGLIALFGLGLATLRRQFSK